MPKSPWPYDRLLFGDARSHMERHASFEAACVAAGVPVATYKEWLHQWSHVPLMVVAKYHNWENERRRILHEQRDATIDDIL